MTSPTISDGMVDAARSDAAAQPPMLRVEHLSVRFPLGRTGLSVHAVNDVSFAVQPGETLGLVGESGSGKTTTARAVMQLQRPASGSIEVDGVELTTAGRRARRNVRRRVQMVFQDPIGSLNPRRSALDVVAEPLHIWGRGNAAERREHAAALLDEVGIDPLRAAMARPHEYSGGQCQRIAIARALVLEPTLLICDEPVSALDVSIQAQVLNLLEDMKARHGLTMLFVAHDLGVVHNISDRIAVMYLGGICEVGPSDDILHRPAHHYTRALIDAIPSTATATATATTATTDRRMDTNSTPAPIQSVSTATVTTTASNVLPPVGCPYQARCPAASEQCRVDAPAIREIAPGRTVACHHPLTN